jgi:sialate O-acetylesterase
MKKIVPYCLLLVFTCFFVQKDVLANAAGLQLASILQSNMVVQQKKPFTIWGKGTPGSIVNVSTSWNESKHATPDSDGNWKLQVKVPVAKPGDFTRHTITIRCNAETVRLTNILIGEVWLCSGQSNMDMSMEPVLPWHNGVTNYKQEIANATYPNIRLFKVSKETSTMVRDTLNGTWKECNPENVKDFSGVAYYFGRRLYNELNIPIGLVQSAYGSAACQAFVKREVLAADAELKQKYLDPYDANPNDKIAVLRPMLIYNAMIHPLINLSIKGFLWYQGESNAGEIKMYPKLNEAMIKNWRDDFQQGNLPFYYVQMTPHDWKKNDPAENGYARFREAQQKILEVKNTGMVCTMDVGEPANIHPNNKKPVGERLAGLALVNDYKKKRVYSGPVFSKIKIKGEAVVVKFKKNTTAGGLNTNDGQAAKHFFVAGDDKVFYPASASIEENVVVLRSPQVKHPVAVRYAFTNYPVTNLQNKAGLPVFPFRTDDWNDEKVIIKSNDK